MTVFVFVYSADTGNEDLSKSLEARVQEFSLDNGLHFIVLPRHTAPIVSCHTYADVGAFDEIDGQTGIAMGLKVACWWHELPTKPYHYHA